MIRLVFIGIVIALLGAGIYTAYYHPDYLPEPAKTYAPELRSKLDSVLASAQSALKKSDEAKPAIMGITSETRSLFQEDTSDKPMHQKALEFTQYQYCKVVVQQYETQHSSASASVSPTEKPEGN